MIPIVRDRDMASPKNSGKGSFTRTLHKWKTMLRKITHETLNNMEDTNFGDDTINSLFDGDRPSMIKVTSIERDSGASMSPVGGNSASELRLTTETEESLIENSETNNGSRPNDTSVDKIHCAGTEEGDAVEEDDDEEEEEVQTFENFNSIAECVKLRNECGEPFYQANEIWERRRGLWTQPAEENTNLAESQRNRHMFASIPHNYYSRIYKKLVLDEKPLREPLNLQDALKVINAGWVETKKWENAAKGLA